MPQRESVDWDFPASVLDVVLMGRYAKLGLFKRPRKADRDIALDCLRKVGMEAFANRQISQLSGGQQRRTFLARALAQQADVGRVLVELIDETVPLLGLQRRPGVGEDGARVGALLLLVADGDDGGE